MTSLRQVRALAAMVVLAAMLLGRGLPTAYADVLTFDDIPYHTYDEHIPNGYGGLNWVKFYLYADPTLAYSGTNYALGTGNWYPAGYEPEVSNAERFDFLSVRIKTTQSMTMRIFGYRNGVQVYYTGTLYPNQYGHINPAPNWVDVDRVEFVRYSGAEWFALDDFTYTRHNTHPDYAIWDDFGHGTTLGALGYTVTAGNPTGLAEIITDPRYAGNALMLMRDTATGDVSVEVAKNASLPLGGADVEFDYRFLTTGKLNVLVGGVLMDTITAPTIGDGSPGNTNNAHYSGTFDLVAAGLTPGDMDVAFELVHAGDPELHIDNVQVSAVVPEPMTVSLLAIGVLLLVRRRR